MTSTLGFDVAVYREPARTYASAWWLAAAMLVGMGIDALLSGAATHAIGWLAALVLVVGADVLAIRGARQSRSITVTQTEVRVGHEAVSRASIVELDPAAAAGRVLGRGPGLALPRGAAGLGLRLSSGDVVVVPTRRPQALRATLQIGEASAEIRPADDHESAGLAELERRADSLFEVAGRWPLPDPAVRHRSLVDARDLLVAGRPPVGFARIDEIDGHAHLEQLSVLPGHMRRGIGTGLLEAACAWAVEHGFREITLCTFAEPDWNAPFFAKRGFVLVSELTPGLAELRDWERSIGLDALGRRVVMRRSLAVRSA